MLEHIPQNINIKEKFEKHYRELLKDDYEKFMEYSLSYIRKCIRVNTLKISVEDIKKRLEERWNLTHIPWCKEGFWIEYKDGKRFDIGNLIEHALGYIYIQESASMIPPVVLNPEPEEIVLDMCASPGSKSTQIAQYMNNTGILICNDVQGDRLKPLGLNLQRCGVTNSIITLMKGEHFKGIEFDKILVDAPCSGTGTIRKSLKTITMWNPAVITKLSRLQKNLAENAFNLLKTNGTMVYSTCTIEPEENEAVVSYLLNKYENAKLEKIDIPIKKTNPILEYENLKINPEVKKCLRIHPYDNDTEGFFVAKIKKE